MAEQLPAPLHTLSSASGSADEVYLGDVEDSVKLNEMTHMVLAVHTKQSESRL